MATGGEVQAVTWTEEVGKSVGVAWWWSIIRVVVLGLETMGGLGRLPWSRTKTYEAWWASMRARSESLCTVLPLVRRWTEIRSSFRPRRIKAWRRIAPDERPSASLSGTIKVFLFDFALRGCQMN